METTKTYSLYLDIASDDPLEDAMKRLLQDTKAAWQLSRGIGPAGGWPEVLITATGLELVLIVSRYTDNELEDMVAFLDDAVERPQWEIVSVTHNEGHQTEHPADECRGGDQWPCSSHGPRQRNWSTRR